MNNKPEDLSLGEAEREYPPELTERFEPLECFSDRGDSQTLLARERATDALAVVKCHMKGSPLFDRAEPEALRGLDAPPLPRFIAEYSGGEMRCVVREYVPGRTLRELADERALDEGEIVEIGIQLCDQLMALHNHVPPVIHRDIKPRNVVIRPDGSAVLIDFGISRVVSGAAGDTLVFGTQGFAPPEQYGFSQTDARSDIFSLGILLNWLQRRDMKLPEKPETPLDRVVFRCAAFDPRRRYASVERVRAALDRLRPQTRRRLRLWRAAAAICVATAIALPGVNLIRRATRSVEFAQPLMEKAARLNLGLADGEPLTRDRLAEVTGVYIVADTAYADSDGFYSGIGRWYDQGGAQRGPLTDLSDLALMPGVRQVCVAAQELTDITSVCGLGQLDKVELKHNYIEDISPLRGMERLTSVGINGNPVRDLSPLEDCPALAFLDLCDVRTYDASVIGRLGNFDYLDISNPTDSYNYLDGKSILALGAGWTGLTDLNVLNGVIGLESLNIGHTAVTDLAPLRAHQGLVSLNIAAVPAGDLTPLLELPMLRELIVSEEMLPRVEALGEVGFEVRVE